MKYLKDKKEDVGFQNRFIGNNSILIGIANTMVPEEEKVILTFQSDNDYEIDEYDVEAIRALMKYGDIILQQLYFTKE